MPRRQLVWPHIGPIVESESVMKGSQTERKRASELQRYLVARGGIEPPTFRFSGGRDVTYEAFVLVKLDELDQSWGSRAHNPNPVADTERMKTQPMIRRAQAARRGNMGRRTSQRRPRNTITFPSPVRARCVAARRLSRFGLEPTAYRRGLDSHRTTVEHNVRPGEGTVQ